MYNRNPNVGAAAASERRALYSLEFAKSLVSNLSMGIEIRRIFDPENKIANSGDDKENPQNYLARVAIAQADALIEELNK